MKNFVSFTVSAIVLALSRQSASAAATTLRGQVVWGTDSGKGKLVAQFAAALKVMSNGEIDFHRATKTSLRRGDFCRR